jgi:ribose 1,5-bisphosphokinase PhnN
MYKIVGSKGVINFIGFKDTEEEANALALQWQTMGLSCVVTKELPND